LVTHAHLDHCGRLPLLVLGGYGGKIYMTAPTLALVEVVLRDAERIASEKLDQVPLYSVHEVEKVLTMVEVVEYDQAFSLGSLEVVFKDAGHILGSSSIKMVDSNDRQTIVFSGDLGNTPEDIVRPTEYFDSSDIVVMEATYGDEVHPVDDPSQILQEEINIIEKTGGVLLIPAFSIERTQEILHRMHHLKREGKIRADLPIFLDGRMGISATTIFKDFKSFYNEELQAHTNDPFMFSGLTITEEVRDSKDIVRAMDPKIIIAGSGMLTGGRILSHAKNYLPIASTRLLLVGYQGEETLGRRILEGEKKIWIDRKMVKVRANVREIKSFSAHADQPKLLTWLGHIKGVTKVFLVHGENLKRQNFADKISEALGITDIILPRDGQEFLLN
jgi:metallo-beta-lactamase family protein